MASIHWAYLSVGLKWNPFNSQHSGSYYCSSTGAGSAGWKAWLTELKSHSWLTDEAGTRTLALAVPTSGCMTLAATCPCVPTRGSVTSMLLRNRYVHFLERRSLTNHLRTVGVCASPFPASWSPAVCTDEVVVDSSLLHVETIARLWVHIMKFIFKNFVLIRAPVSSLFDILGGFSGQSVARLLVCPLLYGWWFPTRDSCTCSGRRDFGSWCCCKWPYF